MIPMGQSSVFYWYDHLASCVYGVPLEVLEDVIDHI